MRTSSPICLIFKELQDLQPTPLKFTVSPDFAPVEQLFISRDETNAIFAGGKQAQRLSNCGI